MRFEGHSLRFGFGLGGEIASNFLDFPSPLLASVGQDCPLCRRAGQVRLIKPRHFAPLLFSI